VDSGGRTGPDPAAWLTTAARHNALDALRRARTLRSKLHLLVEPEAAEMDTDANSEPAGTDAPATMTGCG